VSHIRTAVVALATTALFVVASSPAHALLESFSVTPTSGGAGTEVTVSGTGCSPGVTNTSSDYVMVTATNPVVSLKLSVTNAGAWSGSFTVPSGALPVGAAIDAACFTNGLASVVTTYAPQTFTVTAAPAPTTTTPTTAGATPATTVPRTVSPGPGTPPSDGGSSRTTLPGDNASDPGAGSGGGSATTPISDRAGTARNGGSSGGSSRESQSSVATGDTTTNGARNQSITRDADVARTATDFTDAKKDDGLTWLWWMLVVLGLFIAGAVAMGLRWRYDERAEPTP
jgi:hypothetical protein